MFWEKIHTGGVIVPIKAPVSGNTSQVITTNKDKSKLHQTSWKCQLYHNLLFETNFCVKLYLEAP